MFHVKQFCLKAQMKPGSVLVAINGVDNTSQLPVFRSTNRPQVDLTLHRAKTTKMGLKRGLLVSGKRHFKKQENVIE